MTAPLTEPALVISEMQRGIVDPDRSTVPSLAAAVEQHGVVDRIADLLSEFRHRELPVVHCTIEHRRDQAGMRANSLMGAIALKHKSMQTGTVDVEIPEPISPVDTDIISSRATGITAFYGTNLDAMLRLQGVQTIVLTGVSTDIALPGLALEAVNRGYDVVLPTDCCAGSSAEAYEFMTQNMLRAIARLSHSQDVIARLPT